MGNQPRLIKELSNDELFWHYAGQVRDPIPFH
jgi:hypothetical protein